MHKWGLVGNLIKLGRFHTTATAVSGNDNFSFNLIKMSYVNHVIVKLGYLYICT